MQPEIVEKLTAFFSQFPERAYARKEVLIQAGDPPPCIFYIASGTVREYDITAKGEEVVVTVFKPHAFFPFRHAITKRPNEYFFEAAENVVVRKAPTDAVLAYVRDNPDVMYDLLRRVYIGIEGVLRRQTQLMSGSASSRLSFEILIARRRFGRELASGTCFVSVNEAEFATRTGLTRETVSRCLQKLKRAGCIDVVRGGIVIKDERQLERESGTEPETMR